MEIFFFGGGSLMSDELGSRLEVGGFVGSTFSVVWSAAGDDDDNDDDDGDA